MKAGMKSLILTLTVGVSVFFAGSAAGFWVDPNSFDVNIVEGTTLTETLIIENVGLNDVNFVIRTHVISSTSQSARGFDSTSSAGKGRKVSIPKDHDFTVAGNHPYKQGELIVRFAQDSAGQLYTLERKNQILNSLGGASIKKEFRIVPGLSVVQLPPGMTVEDALPVFNNTNGILYAEPDYEVAVCSTMPDDTLFNELWGMHNTGQSGGIVDADIDAPEAWDISTGSRKIIVAVIDTGVDYTHSDLAANMWVNEGEIPDNGLDDDGNGYIDDVYGYDFCNNDGDPWDDHYHGTHCAGTIGAIGNNNQGVAGVCWNVRIMAVKFLNSAGSGSTSNAILSVEYSTLMGANLSSNSWGGGGYSQGLKDAINAAGAAGMLFVAAAGNDSTNNDSSPHYPSSYDCESIISVMATDRYDNKSSFSNYGPTSVDLGAPGSSILSCKPGNQYQYLNGTSMATPHVAGACALLWSMNPAVSNLEIKNILLQTIDPTLPGLCVSQGRLNLYNAILETKAPWITIVPEEGIIPPGGSSQINVTFDALELAPGIYEAEIVVISNDPCSPTIIPVTMTVNPDDLVVSPIEDFESSGTRGGPFTPKCMTYTLTNRGSGPVSWTTSETEDWLHTEPSEGVLDPNGSIDVNVCITSDANLLDPNIYDQILIFENTNSGSIKLRLVTLMVKPPDCFTELFGSGGSDLSLLSLTFSPNGSVAYYEACREKIGEFPTDPNGGTYLPLGDDDYAQVILADEKEFLFYGQSYDRFYIGSNGYITFGTGDTKFTPSLQNHFSMPRISALFTDLTPADNRNISYKQLEDRVVVTFQNVPLYGDKTATNSVQVEMFFVDGTICIIYLDIAATTAVAGLSEGYGLPPYFLESDLSSYPPCWPYGDFNRDYSVDTFDLAIFVLHWLEEDCGIPYWCEKTDLDFSSTIELADFAIFAENWLAKEDWWLQPVSHWRFDEDSGTIAHDSVGNNHGTIYGATWTTGQINGALSFDGINDYVDCGIDTSLEPANLTIAAWVKTQRTSGNERIVTKLDRDANGRLYGYELLLRQDLGNKFSFSWFYGTTAAPFLHSTRTFQIQTWYFMAATFDDTSKEVNLYINGTKEANSTATGSIAYQDDWPLSIGRETVWQTYFHGTIDDVRIYDRALSAEEIWQLYQQGLGEKAFNPNPADGAANIDPNAILSWSPGKNALSHDVYLGLDYNDVNNATPDSNEYIGNFDVNSFNPNGLVLDTTYYWRIDEKNTSCTVKGDVWNFSTWVEPNLVSWWKFDEGSGIIAYDSAGNNDGTSYGAQWTNGIIGGALSFDGTDDYVDCGIDTSLEPANLTIAAWVKTQRTSGNERIVTKLDRDANGRLYGYELLLRQDLGNKFSFSWFYGTTAAPFLHSTRTFQIQTWYFMAATFDDTSKEVNLYINGTKEANSTATGSIAYQDDWPLSIGRETVWQTYFHGTIDDVRIYDRALSAEEIWQLYQGSY